MPTAFRSIRALVVDDSTFMRKALKRILSSDPGIEVVGEARDGQEGVEMTLALSPDVVTMDVDMPRLNGLAALRRIMAEKPTPVIMVSSRTNEGAAVTIEALASGAIDFIDKSKCQTAMDIADIGSSLLEKVRASAKADLKNLAVRAPVIVGEQTDIPRIIRPGTVPTHLVAIGTSTGGPISLERVLGILPADFPAAVLIVQHMPAGFTKPMADRFDQLFRIRVKEAAAGDRLAPGHVYIGRSGKHLRISRGVDGYFVSFSDTPAKSHIPSVDEMFLSVARVWKGPMMGVVLTGMGSDGAEGIVAMKRAGAVTLAQDERTCVVYGMPKAAWMTGFVDRQLPLDEVAVEILRFGSRKNGFGKSEAELNPRSNRSCFS